MRPISVPYCGEAPIPVNLALRWNLDPLLIAVMLGGLLALHQCGARKGPVLAAGAVLIVLFVSPLCALASALFSARIAHHVILATVAAPLIALALPRGGRGVAAWTLGHAAMFAVWLTPDAYALALASHAAYWLMQASLLGSGVAFWRAVRSVPGPAAVAALLATTVLTGLLGALLTFAGAPLYAWHGATTQAWGLTPLADQQLAGLIMWVPGAGAYLAAALWFGHAWLGGRQRLAAA
jgi:putative membrane protein